MCISARSAQARSNPYCLSWTIQAHDRLGSWISQEAAWLPVFDNAWKALPPDPGFLVPKKAYREVTQWQGKEMRNWDHYLLGLLVVALRQRDSSQAQPFKRAFTCVPSLLAFSM